MFADFKNNSYSATKNKFRKLKDIFDRLSLEALEERLTKLNTLIDALDVKAQTVQTIVEQRKAVPPTIPPQGPVPDLAITSLVPTVSYNGINIAIGITNIGQLASTPTTVSEYSTGFVGSGSVSVPALNPNESVTRNIQIPFDPSGTPQAVTIIAHVNPVMGEINLSNNDASTSLDITAGVKQGYPEISGDGQTYVIFHAHNPEGLEVGQFGFGNADLLINGYYVGSSPLLNPASHNARIPINVGLIPPGTYPCEARFNGMSVFQTISFTLYSTTVLTFEFPRVDMPVNFSSSQNGLINSFPDYYSGIHHSNYTSTFPLSFLGWTEDVGKLEPISFSYTFTKNSFLLDVSITKNPLFINPPVNTLYNQTGLSVVPPDNSTGWLFSPIPVTVPIHTQFTNWLTQYARNGFYPKATIHSPTSGSSYTIISNSSLSGYQHKTILANRAYDSIKFDYDDAYNGGNQFEVKTNPNSSSPAVSTGELSGSLTGGLKISSVPYDILGTGF